MRGTEQLAVAFGRCGAEGRAALIPFLAAGDPDFATTFVLARAAARAGADILELVVPFEHPAVRRVEVRDAFSRALDGGATTRGALRCAAGVAGQTGVPVVLVVARSAVEEYGVAQLCDDATRSGVSGLAVPDLPVGQAGALRAAASASGIGTILVVPPDADGEHIARAASVCTGFVYLMRRRGVADLGVAADDLAARVAAARAAATIPIAAGFGATTPADAADVARYADGVVLGGTIVRAAGEAMLRAGPSERDPGARARAAAQAVDRAVREFACAIRSAGPDDRAGGRSIDA